MIESARYAANGSITVVVDGSTLHVPDDMANRDRRKLAAWEAEGGVIAAYVAPAPVPPPVDPRDVEIADLKAAVSALKKRGVLTDEMIAAEKIDPIKAAGVETLRKA